MTNNLRGRIDRFKLEARPFRGQSGNRSDAQLPAFEDIWHAGSSG